MRRMMTFDHGGSGTVSLQQQPDAGLTFFKQPENKERTINYCLKQWQANWFLVVLSQNDLNPPATLSGSRFPFIDS